MANYTTVDCLCFFDSDVTYLYLSSCSSMNNVYVRSVWTSTNRLDKYKSFWMGSNYKPWSRKINFEPFQIDLNPFNHFGPIEGQGISTL